VLIQVNINIGCLADSRPCIACDSCGVCCWWASCSQGELRGHAPAAAGRLQRRRQRQHLLEDALQGGAGRGQQEVPHLGQQADHLVWYGALSETLEYCRFALYTEPKKLACAFTYHGIRCDNATASACIHMCNVRVGQWHSFLNNNCCVCLLIVHIWGTFIIYTC